MPPAAALPDELAKEILILLPPGEPACLLRASLVSWAWRRLICHPDFLRRLYTLHRRAPLLGFFHGYPPRFAHTTASAFSLAVPNQRSWRVVDCRHGRVLLAAGRHLLVWEPMTGLQRFLQSPSRYQEIGDFNAAVVCSADGCDHRGCQGGLFRVVFLFTELCPCDRPFLFHISAYVYSSETCAWGEPALFRHDLEFDFDKPSTLVGNSLLCFLCESTIVEYDLARHGLTVARLPFKLAYYRDRRCRSRNVLMPAESGGLGVARAEGSCICLWSRDVGANGKQVWKRRRAVDQLDSLLLDIALTASQMGNAKEENAIFASSIGASRIGHVIGFAEEANAVFLSTIAGIFTVELESGRARKVYETDASDTFATRNLLPFTSFYVPAAGKEAAPEEEREEEPVSTLLHL